MKKSLIIHPAAEDEFFGLSDEVQEAFRTRIEVLEKTGRLSEPEGKKMAGMDNVFEMRVRVNGQWRGFYTYLDDPFIAVLHFMNKKTQKTESKAIKLIKKRKKDYE